MKQHTTAKSRAGKVAGGRSRKFGRPQFGGGNERFELSERVSATAYGGLALVHRLTRAMGLPALIDEAVRLFRGRSPYAVSDHVLHLAYNVVAGGRTLDDLELRRQDSAYMQALGATRLPDPTTAGDFLRRFDRARVDDLQEAINAARLRAWRGQEEAFFERAIIDVDGTLAPTRGECKEGMDVAYDGRWGYAPLFVTLANTREILYTSNRPGNRPSHDGCFEYLDPAVELVRAAGFRSVLLRGDCHFALSANFDHWTKERVRFVFGLASLGNLVEIANDLAPGEWAPLVREARTSGGRGGTKRRVKQEVVARRGYKDLRLASEEYAEFWYQPGLCERPYRIVVLRKTVHVVEGQLTLEPEVRLRFYITNAPREELPAREVIRHANERCDQENVIEQAKNGVHALRMPCDTLLANDAYMAIACLAWNLKAWLALVWDDKAEARAIARMEFRRFVAELIAIPTQVVATGRRIVLRFLAAARWVPSLLRAHQRLRRSAVAT